MNCELLAPAGSFESLKTALYFGADAVYCGGPMLQLRAESAGFDLDELQKSIDHTHSLGKKIYVTVNCFARNDEIAAVGEYAVRLYEMGADAVIVSDIGAIAEIREKCPSLPIHVSTQANIQNYKAIEVFGKLGADRVVLGREMTMKEIEELKGRTGDMQLEVFVHGAMCMAYSGRCLLSSYLSNRSGNRGECAQPCRWNYYLIEEKRANMFIPVTEDSGETAIFSSTDLRAIGLIPRLAAAGICSFKIEGRMKSPYYVATVVNAYRQYMDGKAPLETCVSELDCASHRPYSDGFFFGAAKNDPNNDGLYRSDCTFIAVVLKKTGNNEYLVEMRNRFSVGDVLEILSPNSMGLKFAVGNITGADGAVKETADLVQEQVRIICPYELSAGDMLRRRIR